MASLVTQILQQLGATLDDIAPSGFEISCVPRVCHIARTIGVVHQQTDLPFRIAAADAVHVSQIPSVHTYQQVETLVVATRHLASRLSLARDAVLGQFPLGWGIDLIADFLCRCGSRLDIELVVESSLAYQIFHHKLCHRTAADVAVTHEEYSMFHFLIGLRGRARGCSSRS